MADRIFERKLYQKNSSGKPTLLIKIVRRVGKLTIDMMRNKAVISCK